MQKIFADSYLLAEATKDGETIFAYIQIFKSKASKLYFVERLEFPMLLISKLPLVNVDYNAIQ